MTGGGGEEGEGGGGEEGEGGEGRNGRGGRGGRIYVGLREKWRDKSVLD